MSPGRISLLIAGFLASLTVAACAKPLGPETCGERACPAGTFHENYSANRVGFEVDLASAMPRWMICSPN